MKEQLFNLSDEPSAIRPSSPSALFFNRALFVFLFLFALCAPISIAATQTCWVLGLLLWAGLSIFRPRPKYARTPLDSLLIAFFLISIVSALASYAPDISISKLRSVSLLTIAFLFAQNIRTHRFLRALTFALIFASTFVALFTVADRAIGRGVRVEKLTGDSPLLAVQIYDGDTILKVNNRRIRNLDELDAALRPNVNTSNDANAKNVVKLLVYRTEAYLPFELQRGAVLAGDTPEARLGVVGWSHGRDQRAMGFYDHYTTYAEALQLIASLVLGLLISTYRAGRLKELAVTWLPKFATWGVLFMFAFVCLTLALLLTVTRASWLSFLVSSFVIVLMAARTRKQTWVTALVMIALAAPLIVGGLFLLQQKRKVGFYDTSDGSILYRETIYAEAVGLFTKNPRNFLIGVGMDSTKRYKDEWGLFDHGRLPPGHFHSEPLQIAVERGIFALIVWFVLIVRYLRMLFPLARGDYDAHALLDKKPTFDNNVSSQSPENSTRNDFIERGIALGAFGGTIGFITSGMVHNNLGDSEVAMIFYFLMGLALIAVRFARENTTKSV
ncbi:MAG: hypothetical protein NVSMB56_13020 [Pyrinomonadaceae bacterium]